MPSAHTGGVHSAGASAWEGTEALFFSYLSLPGHSWSPNLWPLTCKEGGSWREPRLLPKSLAKVSYFKLAEAWTLITPRLAFTFSAGGNETGTACLWVISVSIHTQPHTQLTTQGHTPGNRRDTNSTTEASVHRCLQKLFFFFSRSITILEDFKWLSTEGWLPRHFVIQPHYGIQYRCQKARDSLGNVSKIHCFSQVKKDVEE